MQSQPKLVFCVGRVSGKALLDDSYLEKLNKTNTNKKKKKPGRNKTRNRTLRVSYVEKNLHARAITHEPGKAIPGTNYRLKSECFPALCSSDERSVTHGTLSLGRRQ